MIEKAHDEDVTDLAALGNGGWVSASDEESEIRVWTADGKAKAVFKGHSMPLSALTVLDDGETVVSGDKGGTVIWWSAKDGSELGRVQAVTSMVMSLCALKGSLVAVGLYDNPVTVIDVKTGKVTAKFHEDSKGAGSLFALAGGSKLVAKWRLYDVSSPEKPGIEIKGLDPYTSESVAEVCPGRVLSFQWRIGTVCLWSVSELRVTHPVLAMVPLGERLVKVLWDGSKDTFHAVCESGSVYSFKLTL